MKSFKFLELGINPIYRDIALLMLTGLFVSLALVTMGYMIFYSQG